MAKRKYKTATCKPGDLVLVGRPGISMPSDWFLAKVLCVAGDEVATEHTDMTGGIICRQFVDISHIRAVGPVEALATFKRQCSEATKEHWRKVSECESALGRARDEVWRKLDEYAAGDPPQFAIEEQAA